MATEFRSEKIPQKRLKRVSAEESAHSEVYGRVNSEARNGMELQEKNVFCKKSCSSKQGIPICIVFRGMVGSERNFESLLLYLFHKRELRAFFSSAEWFRMEFQEFYVPRKSRNSAGTNQFFHLFRGTICRNLSTLFQGTRHERRHGCIVTIVLNLVGDERLVVVQMLYFDS